MSLGAATGALTGLGVLALAAGRVLDGGLGAVVVNEASGRARTEFLVSQGGLFLLVVVAGLAGGAVLGALGYVIGREATPDAPRISLGPLAIVGSATGLVVAFAITRALLGASADISGGIVTLSVFRATVIALAAGAGTGLVIGGAIERLADREIYGFEGAAWPSSPVAFAREAAAAVGLPLLALVSGAAVVWGLSWVLLESSKEVALIVFGAVAALVLAGAAFIAAHPPRRRNGG
jgi:hypothetical protein